MNSYTGNRKRRIICNKSNQRSQQLQIHQRSTNIIYIICVSILVLLVPQISMYSLFGMKDRQFSVSAWKSITTTLSRQYSLFPRSKHSSSLSSYCFYSTNYVRDNFVPSQTGQIKVLFEACRIRPVTCTTLKSTSIQSSYISNHIITTPTTTKIRRIRRLQFPTTTTTTTTFGRHLQYRKTFSTLLESNSATDVDTEIQSKRRTSRRLKDTSVVSDKVSQSPSSSSSFFLVIVESPSKCSTIEKILNGYVADTNLPFTFKVVSCMGHVRNLVDAKEDKIRRQQQSSSTTTTIGNESVFPYNIPGVDLSSGQYTPIYSIEPKKLSIVSSLQKEVSNPDCIGLLLATDPDREGEAMAWHLSDVLGLSNNKIYSKKKKSKSHLVDYKRIRFTEITPDAIIAAVQPAIGTTNLNKQVDNNNNDDDDDDRYDDLLRNTNINYNLVRAQETRRVLDRLAGFTVSPLLWKKIAPGLSAGRVQSVGMALVVQRERERLQYESSQYYTIHGQFVVDTQQKQQQQQRPFPAKLHSINGTAVVANGKDFTNKAGVLRAESATKLHLKTEHDAIKLTTLIGDPDVVWTVGDVKTTRRSNRPPIPYKTSTLQQDGSRALNGMPVQQVMRIAQQLYEQGLISYMRTDSTTLSQTAVSAMKPVIKTRYGSDAIGNIDLIGRNSFKEKSTKKKKKKEVSIEEAHEAIRPAIQSSGSFYAPEEISFQTPAAESLYRLIYQRTLACGMKPLITNQTSVSIHGTTADSVYEFRSSGSVVIDPGYTVAHGNAYTDSNDVDSDSNQNLPPVLIGQDLQLQNSTSTQHETQPPARYTEASLVQELESLGVGRPSTFARIVQILRDRAYVGSPQSGDNPSRRPPLSTIRGSAISAVRAAGSGDVFGGTGSARGPLIPSLSAFVVCSLLEKYCPTYVDPGFTAQMESRLDQIASGDIIFPTDDVSDIDDNENDSIDTDDDIIFVDTRNQVGGPHVPYLNEFYAGPTGLAAQIKHVESVIDANEARRVDLHSLTRKDRSKFTSEREAENEMDIGLFIGPWGPYVQKHGETSGSKSISVPLPAELAADLSSITFTVLKSLLSAKEGGGIVLGVHPSDGRNVILKTGRFGAFLQWGDDEAEGTTTHSIPKKFNFANANENDIGTDEGFSDAPDSEDIRPLNTMMGLSLEQAIGYCSLPRTITTLDELPIIAGLGPYGPYLKYNGKYVSVKNDDVLTIDKERAVQLVLDGIVNKVQGKSSGVLVEIGEKEGALVTVKRGRFGPYISWKSINAKLPTEYGDTLEELPLEVAWKLVQEKKLGKPLKTLSIGPPPPKRPMSAYLHFCSVMRTGLSNSGMSLGEVSKELAKRWSETPEDGRQPYLAMAAASKAEYQSKLNDWGEEMKSADTPSKASIRDKTESVATRKTKGKTKIAASQKVTLKKRSKSAYLYFCEEKRPEVSKRFKKLGEISKELAKMWAEESNREIYEKLAAEDKARQEEVTVVT